MEILLKAEKIGQIGPLVITNTLIASTLVVLFFIFVACKITKTNYNLKSGFYNFVEMIIEGFLTVIEGVVGRGEVAKQAFGIIVTFFLFIMANNWFGIMPGMGAIGFYEPKSAHSEEVTEPAKEEKVDTHAEKSVEKPETEAAEKKGAETNKEKEEMIFVPLLRSANSDLNMTLAIALISVLFIQIISIKNLGLKNYLSKFFNFKNPILLFVGLLEIISEIVKIFSFSFRLFGNIFAGDVLLIVIFGLVPFIAPIPFMGIELFAGFVQALIFSALTLVFINVSVSHGESH